MPEEAPGGLLVTLEGPDHGAKEEAARHLAACLGRPLLALDTPQLLALDSAPGLVARIGAVFREALLQPAVLFWRQADALVTPDPALVRAQATLREALATWPGCCLFDLAHDRPDAWPNSGPVLLHLDFALPPLRRAAACGRRRSAAGRPRA